MICQKWYTVITDIYSLRINNFKNEIFTCILVFTTSIGVFPKTEHPPAIAPKIPVTTFGITTSLSPPLYQSFNVSIVQNLIAWFDDCFKIVGTNPWYMPLIPKKLKNLHHTYQHMY